MKPYISQPKGSMSCGAYSIAYYLWETDKAQCINDKTFVDNIYKKIQVGPNNMGMPEACSNPEKISKELSDNWHSYAYGCILSNSPLMPLAKGFNISGVNTNVFDKIKPGVNKYAIILCSSEISARALHYILIKYEDNTFKMLNSSAIYGNGIDNVVWENFIIESNGKITLERDTPYLYTGAGILIE
ncbi:hypothetical protein [Clostridium estertheticum]|uniref:hypothetical protein n=1 Tax=Clostridium estertheticum TaxID=238834 RepID=UPI001C6E4172|nr:hypothetical protein [Clostridium estertheticum]MBW9154319.1 hypothetical protein [Clostridium estertheticum]WLC86640.1 hypothetical protein KTC97_21625 [Clostridium estertheticum]